MDRVTAYQNAVAHNAEIDRLESETGISPKGMTHDQFMQAVSDHYGQFPGDLPEGSGTGPEPTEWVTTADGEEIPWNERKLPLPPPEGGDLFGGQKAAAVARAPEPTIRTDPRQAVMPGMEGNAVQAQAARDAVPNVGRVPQVRPDEGLFARAETVQPELAPKPIGGNFGRQFQEDTRGSDQHPLMQAADWVFRRGREDGNERLVGIDMHTEQPIFAHGIGERNFVTTPAEGLRAMAEPGAAVAFVHNHPRGSPLSLQDIQMGAHPGVAQVVAVGHGAEFSAARVLPEFLGRFPNHAEAALGVARAYNAASRRLGTFLGDAIRRGKLDQPSAERMLGDAVLRALHSEGVIDYTSSVHVPHGEMHLADTNASIFSGHALVASPAEGIARVREQAAKVALERRPQGAAGDQAGQATSGVAGSARPDQGALGFAEHQPSLDLPPPGPIEDGQDFESRLSRVRVIGPALASVFHRVAGPETTGAQLLDAVRPWTEGVKKAAAPMAMGGRFESVALEARAQAKNYQNLIEYIHRIGRDGTAYLGKTFDRPSLARMFNAMEAEHQAELNGTEAGAEGVAGLSEPERQAVHAVRETTRRTAAEAQSLGMLPPKITSWYVPHDVAGLGEGDPNKVRVVRDLRAVMLKTMKLQEAIAGRRLINAIRDSGVSAGIETVREGSGTGRPLNPFGSEFSTTTGNLIKRKYQTIEETEAAARQLPQRASDYFTIPENAAFWRWRINGQDAEGEPTWERVPIQVHQAWDAARTRMGHPR